MTLRFVVNRNLEKGTYTLEEVFPGLKDLEVVKEIFSKYGTDDLKVEIVDSVKYMRVLDENGIVLISVSHLRKSDEKTLFLDTIHELVHVRQYLENKELYDKNYEYVERPTEIEAYKLVVKLAREIGMTDKEIREYLQVEWINKEQLNRLLSVLKVKHIGLC
jgi:hypothetical protein